MLARLQIKNYVLIDSLEIDFPEGLIIITGQTGAGKSILLGALSLLMGTKADASVVSSGAENCVVEAEFEAGTASLSLRQLLEENEIDWEDGHLIIRRVVNRSGRSRSFINDSPVPVTLLQEISSYLIDIHSQHQTLLLSDRQFQLDMVDDFAGNSALREQCELQWKALGQKRTELKNLEQRLARMSAEKDYNQAQYEQLEAASLTAGELAELEDELKQLSNAEEIKLNLSTVEEVFAPSGDAVSLSAALKEAERLLSRIGKYVPAVSSLAERVDSCRMELEDILSDVVTINSRVDLSQERLTQVEERMSLIYSLMKKHGCHDELELISFRDRLSSELGDTTVLEEAIQALSAEVAGMEEYHVQISDKLHDSRLKALPEFSRSVTESVKNLELPYAVFEASLTDRPLSASGRDGIEFRFSASGQNPVDVAKCASGGELSRIMLALKAMKARYSNMPTMIFDEIDTGVSGSVADKMGSLICQMGEYMQVFAITHLPQVAAKGAAHYLVSKDIDAVTSVAVSKIKRLSSDERVLEIARMLSGSVMTDAAIANAKALIGA